MLRIFVDADACPVKEEVYRVARRYELPVSVVANARMRVPNEDGIDLVIVPGDFDVLSLCRKIAKHQRVTDLPRLIECIPLHSLR